MNLFDEYPTLENDWLVIHKMSIDDADALGALATNPNVYRYLPTFLYEQKYPDPREVLSRMDAECFDTKESVLMGIYLKNEPRKMAGIAEVYAYEERKPKASIGYRLNEPYWGKGIATAVAGLLKDYLFFTVNMRTVTAHVMRENLASAHVLMNNGFIGMYRNCLEDWGFPESVLVDKYVYKKRWFTTGPDV